MSLQLLISASRVFAPVIYYVVCVFAATARHGPTPFRFLPRPTSVGRSVAIILLIEIKSNRLVVRGVFRVCARVLNAFHLPAKVDYTDQFPSLSLSSSPSRRENVVRSKNDLCTARCVVSDRIGRARTIEFRREFCASWPAFHVCVRTTYRSRWISIEEETGNYGLKTRDRYEFIQNCLLLASFHSFTNSI